MSLCYLQIVLLQLDSTLAKQITHALKDYEEIEFLLKSANEDIQPKKNVVN